MKQPVIGITPSHNLENGNIRMSPDYLKAIKTAGGLPLLLPLDLDTESLNHVVQLCDGFLFSGGPDIHPFYLGEDTHINCGQVSPKRDALEFALLPLVMEAKKPILGICRGAQVINTVLGGDLYQDIPSQTERSFPVCHNQPFEGWLAAHHVAVREGSRLYRIAGNSLEISVNSFHHQAVRKIGEGLTVAAVSPDGIAEALEMPDYPYLLALQWHPERMWENDPTSAQVFKSFIEACCSEDQ